MATGDFNAPGADEPALYRGASMARLLAGIVGLLAGIVLLVGGFMLPCGL